MDDEFDDDGEWVGTTAACAMLALTARELYREINEGRLPAYRFGRVIRMRRRDVENFGKGK